MMATKAAKAHSFVNLSVPTLSELASQSGVKFFTKIFLVV
jgi:hypothetical protein